MKKVKSLFDSKQLKMLKEIGIELSDEKDYNDDELDDIYDEITGHYQVAAFKEGEPVGITADWEEIIDTFYDKTNR